MTSLSVIMSGISFLGNKLVTIYNVLWEQAGVSSVFFLSEINTFSSFHFEFTGTSWINANRTYFLLSKATAWNRYNRLRICFRFIVLLGHVQLSWRSHVLKSGSEMKCRNIAFPHLATFISLSNNKCKNANLGKTSRKISTTLKKVNFVQKR